MNDQLPQPSSGNLTPEQPPLTPQPGATVAPDTSPHQAPQPSQSGAPRRKSFGLKLLITLGVAFFVIVGFIIGLIALIGGGIFIAVAPCNHGRSQVFSQAGTIAGELNAVDFIPGQTNVKATIDKTEGDCIDSVPAIFATRTFTVSTDAGTLYDEMSKALIQNGYTVKPSAQPYEMPPCDIFAGEVPFVKQGKHEIDIQFTCLGNDLSETHWRQVPVNKATATISIFWKSN